MNNLTALFSEPEEPSRPIHLVPAAELGDWLKFQSETTRTFFEAKNIAERDGISFFPGEGGNMEVLVVPPTEGTIDGAFARLPGTLPSATYRLAVSPSAAAAERLLLAWGGGAYKFRQRSNYVPSRLIWPKGVDRMRVLTILEVRWFVRDLINNPAGQMGPAELQQVVERISRRFEARLDIIEGDDLLERGFGSIHIIGRASPRAPRLIDLRWGEPHHYKLTLVGKGVCFDTGGYNLKGTPAIGAMKMDVGGTAQAIGLAQLIMALDLPVCLRLLVPAVDNILGTNAVFPGDTVVARNGKVIEVANTDAEGRVILADALVEACGDRPDLLVDFATLTGAARVALGPEISALFCNDDEIANALIAAGNALEDPLWRLPLYPPYRTMLESDVADVTNHGTGPLTSFAGLSMGGAIQAALFLEHFVERGTAWAHFDILGLNMGDRPGRPPGGEAVGIWALLSFLEQRLDRGKRSQNSQ